MNDADAALRAGEIAIAAASALVRLIVEAIESGKNEEEALRHALATLSAQPDLTPVLPKVRLMVAAQRARILAERIGRSDEPTAEVLVPGSVPRTR